ncbi:MAG TPA: YebC/PmpR family DNA-binding transcriptional regulator [Clostridiales bacterium]|nr:YebC/PmpR family DNA-binding transcriptional regulator [Clostridiales bacterium]
MSGHSKWANIKHKKGKSDAQKGKIFTKLGREILVAVKAGGPDPEGNSRLKDIIAKAKAANMPNDNITRSIKKAAGDADSTNYEEVVYEGYGPGGVAVIVNSMTDNRNRTAGDVRHLFDKHNGNLGTTNCVSFMFDKKGVIVIEKKDDIDEEELMMQAIEAGAEDFTSEDDYYEIITDPADFSSVREALEKDGYEFASAELDMIPQNYVKLENENHVASMEKLVDGLEELDDVQEVYHNWEQDE